MKPGQVAVVKSNLGDDLPADQFLVEGDLGHSQCKGILRKVNKLALTALRLAASRKATRVEESILLDATTEALL